MTLVSHQLLFTTAGLEGMNVDVVQPILSIHRRFVHSWEIIFNLGFCDGRCGPNDGCPCNSCRDFLSTTILRPSNALSLNGLRNSDGYIVWKGGQRGGSGGDTGLSPSLVYYCGRRMNQCRCGNIIYIYSSPPHYADRL